MMNWKPILTAVCAALLVDVQAFYAAKKKDPTAKFRLDLMLVRAVIGLLTGFSLGG